VKHLGESVFDNPQTAVGPDVLARIHHVETPGGLERAQPIDHQGNQQPAATPVQPLQHLT
jgi:hypothetical protein